VTELTSLWAPVIQSRHAACAYWISPPRPSRRTTLPGGARTTGTLGSSGGACLNARCGRWPSKWSTYSASTDHSCRPPTISIRSSRSRRKVHEQHLQPLQEHSVHGKEVHGQLHHQRLKLGRHSWATTPVRVPPAASDQLLMPAQQRLGPDEQPVPPRAGQQPAQPSQHGPVGPVHPGSGHLTPQHLDLVAQHEQLGVLGGRAPRQHHQPSQQLAEDQIEQSKRHPPIICASAWGTERRSCSSLVLVQETAEQVASVDPGWRVAADEGHSSDWTRRLKLQGPVRAMSVVVRGVHLEGPLQMPRPTTSNQSRHSARTVPTHRSA
jgi:hypothetical protein